ncbi:Protein FAR1-RELATED SEQUENCE 5 [Bienertia sinuspersici]
MDCDGVVGGDDVVDDVNGGIECDEVYQEGSDVVRGAGLDELDVDQCVGDSNIGIRFGSGWGYNKCDNGTQREAGTEMTNGDGVVTSRVGSVYSSWEEVERMFKDYGKKKGFCVIRGQSAYSVGTKKKRAMTMRCECYRCPDMKLKSDEKKRQKTMEVGGCSGEELKFRRRRKSKKCSCAVRVYASLNREQLREIRKVSLEHIGHKPELGQAKLVKQYRMEHFTASMRSRVLNDIDAGVPVANIHGSIARERDDQAAAMRQPIKNVFPDTRHKWCIWHILRKLPHKLGRNEKAQIHSKFANGIPLEIYFQRTYTDAKFRAFQRECERLIYCYVKEEIAKGDQIYSYVIEDRVWKTGKGGIHEYLTPKRRLYNCENNIVRRK